MIVRVFGNVHIAARVNDTETPLSLGNRKSRAMLAVLAMHDQRTITRERLAGLLWGDKEQSRSHSSLRNALFEVRRELTRCGLGGVLGDDAQRHIIRIDHDLIDVDLNRVFAELAHGRIDPLLLDHERVFDSLLDYLNSIDEEFGHWVTAKRTTYARRALERIEDLMRAPSATTTTREQAARALGNLDPSNEEAIRVRMRALAERGDSGAALTLFVELNECLNDDLGIPPSPPTIALYSAIKRGEIAVLDDGNTKLALPAEPIRLLHPGQRLLIAICAFDLSGVTEALHPYVKGFRGDLIGSLVQFREWDIHEPKQIWDAVHWPQGRNGEYVIAAQAMEAEGAIRLTLSLHDLYTMKVVDAEKIHVSRETWFTAQDAVIRQLARWLNLNVSEERIKAFGRGSREHPPLVYDIWLKHDQRKHLFTPAQWLEAEAALLGLIAEHPEFDRAYASLAALYNTKHYLFPGVYRDRDLHEKALELARQAIHLDPKGVYGYRAAAYSHALLNQYDRAEHYFRLVMELNENAFWSQFSAAAGLGICGNWDEAGERMSAVLSATHAPTPDMYAYYAYNCLALGDLETVLAVAPHAPQMTLMRAMSAAALALTGDVMRARRERDDLFKTLRGNWVSNRPATDDDIANWIASMTPAAKDDARTRLLQGLAMAGGVQDL